MGPVLPAEHSVPILVSRAPGQPFLVLAGTVLTESCDRDLVKDDHTPTSRLRGPEDDGAANGDEGPPNLPAASLEVDVVPGHSQCLAAAAARDGVEAPEGVEALVLDRGQERLQLLA
jgi:hypothetical protein